MSTKFIPAFWLVCTLAMLSLFGTNSSAAPADLKLEAQLIWGTNDPKPQDPKLKPVEPAIGRKLKSSPFKWENYFEVNRRQIAVPKSGTKKELMSKHCELEIKNLGNNRVELQLFGKGKLVEKRTQALPKGQWLVIGGNAENLTAWFVVLKQVE